MFYKVEVNSNESTFMDNPFQNPYQEEATAEWEYLTVDKYEVVKREGELANKELFVLGSVRLSDTKYIRQRIVFDIVTLIAEISGFADLFLVIIGFLMGTFYTPLMYDASLVKSMAPVNLPPS